MSKPTYEELEKKLKDFEQKLHELELHNLCSIYSQSSIPTLILSKGGKIFEYNEAMIELTGYTYAEVPDLNAWMTKICPEEEYRNKFIEISRKSQFREINVKNR